MTTPLGKLLVVLSNLYLLAKLLFLIVGESY